MFNAENVVNYGESSWDLSKAKWYALDDGCMSFLIVPTYILL